MVRAEGANHEVAAVVVIGQKDGVIASKLGIPADDPQIRLAVGAERGVHMRISQVPLPVALCQTGGRIGEANETNQQAPDEKVFRLEVQHVITILLSHTSIYHFHLTPAYLIRTKNERRMFGVKARGFKALVPFYLMSLSLPTFSIVNENHHRNDP